MVTIDSSDIFYGDYPLQELANKRTRFTYIVASALAINKGDSTGVLKYNGQPEALSPNL